MDPSNPEHYDDIAYQYLVHPDGTIYEGRFIAYKSAASAHSNTGKIGILIMGNYDPGSPFNDKVTKDAVIAVEALIKTLKSHFPLKTLGGHRDFKKTECPGDDLYKIIPGLRNSTGLAAP
jgi:hypothetical protein